MSLRLGEEKGLGMLPEVFGLTWGPDTLRWDCISSKTHAGCFVRDKQAKLEVFQWKVISFQLGLKNFSCIGKFSFTLKVQ